MWASIWKYLRWGLVIPVVWQFIRWIFSSIFLGLHRLFRSSKKVHERRLEAYDDFYESRHEQMDDLIESHGTILLHVIMMEQRSRYITIETLRKFMKVYCVNAETMRKAVDTDHWNIIDLKNIETELNISFNVEHYNRELTPKIEKEVAKDYHGAFDDDEPVEECIGDLIRADATAVKAPQFGFDRF